MNLTFLGLLVVFALLIQPLHGWTKSRAKVLPGSSCGVNTPFRRYKSGEDTSWPLECVFFESRRNYENFLDECFQSWHTNCKQRLPHFQLEDKAQWRSYADQVYQDRPMYVAAHAHDNTDKGFLSSGENTVLHIDLSQPHHVFKMILRLFPGLTHTMVLIEARVGTVNTIGLAMDRYLTTNEVCYKGDSLQETPRDYDCPHPLWGRFLSFRKTEQLMGWAFGIKEVEVFVVNL